MFPAAVIIGLDSLPGLQAARVLAKRGIPVIGILRSKSHWTAWTNTCKQILVADTQSEDFISALQKLGPTLPSRAVLFPCTDMSVLLVSQYRAVLEKWFNIPLANHATVQMLLDKLSFYEFLDAHNLPYAKTIILRSAKDAERIEQELSFPIILKPSVRKPSWTKNSPKKVFLIKEKDSFKKIYEQCQKWAEILIAQEWVEGSDENLFSGYVYFNKNSEPLVTFVAKKIRQFPPQAGITALGIECQNDYVLETTVEIFKKSSFYGLGYVEMKFNPETQQYFIMEANIGRPTVRSALAETAGVEMLYTMYCDALGLELPKNRTQHYRGIKWLNLHHDLRAAWYYWRTGQLTIRGWLRSLAGPKHHAVFSWHDPLPFFTDIFQAFSEALRKRLPFFKKRQK